MKIKITKEDIYRGQSRSACNCPIAQALKRCTGIYNLSVGKQSAVYTKPRSWTSSAILLPIKVQQFIQKFDNNQEVKPFSFQIDDI